jgi:hypothetical protein
VYDADARRLALHCYNPNMPTSGTPITDATPFLSVQYWHGTGRFQYDKNGKVVDVLQQIIDDGGLKPHEDPYDLTQSMVSVSLAKKRDYAVLYADMHANNPENIRRNRSKRQSVNTYIRGVKQQAFVWFLLRYGIAKTLAMAKQNRRKMKYDDRWSKKVNRSEPSIRRTFLVGSDIPGNYPILIGLRAPKSTLEIAPYLAKHEIRTQDTIPFSQFTHIEVPQQRASEVSAMLTAQKITVAVVATENVEELVS